LIFHKKSKRNSILVKQKIAEMKKIFLLIFFLLLSLLGKSQVCAGTDSCVYIQLSLLLDVSGSMQGLLDQAKSQIWSCWNHIENFEKEEKEIITEVALLSYGNNLYENDGHVKLISDFSNNIDTLADKLFNMESGGGNEYCGKAIIFALDSLDWKMDNAYKFIFISGNEPFDQGPIEYKIACQQADSLQVKVNTIFCGKFEVGIDQLWETASINGNGKYTNINHDINYEEYKTPYDNRLVNLYQQYIGTFSNEIELEQSINNYRTNEIMDEISPAYRDMIIYKFEKNKNEKDLLEKIIDRKVRLQDLAKEDLPESWQQLSNQELKRHILKQSQQRTTYQRAIDLFIKKINEYLDIKLGEQTRENTLDDAIQEIIEIQLLEYGFSKKKNQ